MERLYGLHRDAKGAIAIQPYEGAVLECECEPADSSQLKRSAGQWADLQVETAVLQEAANQYKARHGRLPESLNELTQPYPNNWLSGRSKAMEEMFGVLMKHMSHRAGGHEDQPGQLPSGNDPEDTGYWGHRRTGILFEQPLQVIIDRKHHRLAVVSGTVMLRNYAVGLGERKRRWAIFVSMTRL